MSLSERQYRNSWGNSPYHGYCIKWSVKSNLKTVPIFHYWLAKVMGISVRWCVCYADVWSRTTLHMIRPVVGHTGDFNPLTFWVSMLGPSSLTWEALRERVRKGKKCLFVFLKSILLGNIWNAVILSCHNIINHQSLGWFQNILPNAATWDQWASVERGEECLIWVQNISFSSRMTFQPRRAHGSNGRIEID